MVNVLIDAHMLGSRETGNETYTLNLVRQWRVLAEHGFHVNALVRPGYIPEPDWQHLAVPLSNSSDLHRLTLGLRDAARQTNAAGVHVTYHAPLWLSIPSVVTIHDVSYRVRMAQHRLRNVVLQNVLGALSARRARAVITDSKFSRAEIERVYPFLRGRIFVMLGAADERLKPQPPKQVQAVLNRFGIHPPYVLWVGAFQTRKNVYRLVEAFLRLSQEFPEHQLVLVADPSTPIAARLYREYADEIKCRRIKLVGYIEDRETLACLYTGCSIFVFPSLYEGFGLPVLEAMQCGAPVITSQTTALPEVAGDAAVLVDPEDVDEITGAIRHVLASPALRQQLRERGLQRAALFSWSDSAARVAEAYKFAFGSASSAVT